MWGEPTQIFLNYVGVFNPFWLLIFLFNALGLSFYQSFLCSITLYFWVGQLGFYLLAKRILKNSSAAYSAFLLFLFSSLSLSVYAQFHPPLLYIPGIWFFYFLFSFLQKPAVFSWLGIIFSAAIILTSYLPFYFLTVFLILMPLVIIFYFSAAKEVVLSTMRFVQTHIVMVVVSLGVLVLSFMPGFLAYQSTAHQEIVAPFRNEDVNQKTGVYFNNYERIAKNGFSGRMDLEDLYSNFDLVQYGDDCFFYVSLFIYIVLILGAAVRINKVLAICALTALPLFFLMMTSAAGFHRFLFEHVSYFRLIRNMHFFLAFFIAAVVLLASEQMRVFFNNRKSLVGKKRALFLFFVLIVHFGLGIFLLRQTHVAYFSYATLAFSLLFWLLFIFDHTGKNEAGLTVLLFLSIIFQPMQVIADHNQRGILACCYTNKAFIEQAIKAPSVKPVFAYTRSVSSRIVGNDDTASWRITMKDASRFFENGFPTFWSYDLTLKVPFEDLQKYTANKFYIYDAIDVLKNDERLEDLVVNIREDRNVALVSAQKDMRELTGLIRPEQRTLSTPVTVIHGPSAAFKVTYFDVNSIKIQTQYPGEKFLVYTDNYHKGWQAFINGQPAVVYRANMAFKAMRLPPGDNEIYLCYKPSGVLVISVALAIVLFMMWVLLVWFWAKERSA